MPDPELIRVACALAVECRSHGATHIFVGHPTLTEYECVGVRRLRGTLSEAFASALLVSVAALRPQLLALDDGVGGTPFAGLTVNGRREVVCISWSADVPPRAIPKPASINTPPRSEIWILGRTARSAAVLGALVRSTGASVRWCTDTSLFLRALQERQPHVSALVEHSASTPDGRPALDLCRELCDSVTPFGATATEILR